MEREEGSLKTAEVFYILVSSLEHSLVDIKYCSELIYDSRSK